MNEATLSGKLRALIRLSGKSARKIQDEAGLVHPVILRFMTGGGITLETAEKLFDYFGVAVIFPKQKQPRKKMAVNRT